MDSTKIFSNVEEANKQSKYHKKRLSWIIIISAVVSMIVTITTLNFYYFLGVNGLIEVIRYSIGIIALIIVAVMLRYLSGEIQDFMPELMNDFLLDI